MKNLFRLLLCVVLTTPVAYAQVQENRNSNESLITGPPVTRTKANIVNRLDLPGGSGQEKTFALPRSIAKSNQFLLRRPTVSRIKRDAFYRPDLAKTDELKNTYFAIPYDVPRLSKIGKADFNIPMEGSVFRYNQDLAPDITSITHLPSAAGEVSIAKKVIVFKTKDGGYSISNFETKGALRDHNGRIFTDEAIADNIERFDDVKETVHASLIEVLTHSGYTPSKLLLDFNKKGGVQFDLHIFQSLLKGDEKGIRLNELDLRTDNSQKTRFTRI